jgi:hypothetical protein
MPDRSKESPRPLGPIGRPAPLLGRSKALVRRQKNREIRASKLLKTGIRQRAQAFGLSPAPRVGLIDSEFVQTN